MRQATWNPDDTLPWRAPGALGWLRAGLRGVPFLVVTFGGLGLLLLLRLIERPLWKQRRPWTPHITRFVCRAAFAIMGIRYRVHGRDMRHPGAMVANHSSWLDIFALNAPTPIYFVSKAEVQRWPGIGWLARATGTVFIRRDARDARVQKRVFEQRLKAGHRLLFFPEGTSNDSQRVLPFKSTLYAAFFNKNLRPDMWIQPVSVIYRAPEGEDPRFYGWWGDMEFAPHLLQVLAVPRQGSVDVVFHAAVRVAAFEDRKELARYCETVVRAGVRERIGPVPEEKR